MADTANEELLTALARRLFQEVANPASDSAARKVDRSTGESTFVHPAYKPLRDLDDQKRKAVLCLIDEVTIDTIAALFALLDADALRDEQDPERISVSITDGQGQPFDVASLSDGLQGELFGETGWLEKFYRYAGHLRT